MSTVFVLFHETNTGQFDESDGYIEAVYATEELAEAARREALREAVAHGTRVWVEEDDPALVGVTDDVEIEDMHWSDCWRIVPCQVLKSFDREGVAT